MRLNITLIAENEALTVQIDLADTEYNINVSDKKKKKSSIRGFDTEQSMWSYIQRLNLEKEDFKIIPF